MCACVEGVTPMDERAENTSLAQSQSVREATNEPQINHIKVTH